MGEVAGRIGEAFRDVDATNTVPPKADTAVGSPSSARLPIGCGFAGSLMSIMPITPSGLSE